MKNAVVHEKISILKCPKFWRIKTNNYDDFEGEFFHKEGENEQYEKNEGICIILIANSVKIKTDVKKIVNTGAVVNYL